MTKKLNIGLIFGSRSVEHEVSVISALTVYRALNQDKYNVIPIYISKSGRWWTDKSLLELSTFKKLSVDETLLVKFRQVLLPADPDHQSLLASLDGRRWQTDPALKIDVFLITCHGSFGEDGTLQGLLELANKPYTGPNVVAAAVSMDKIIMKKVFQAHHFPLVKYFSFDRSEWQKSPTKIIALTKDFKYPLFVKPASLGSSIGVTRVDDDQKVAFAIEVAAQFDNKIIIEEAVVGAREINCTVIGSPEQAKASELEEIVVDSSKTFHDYDSKYLSGGKTKRNKSGNQSRLIPARLPEDLTNQIKKMAVDAFQAVEASGIARVDFLIDRDEKIYLNEINSIPGMLSSYFWKPSGTTFTKALDELIEIAFDNWKEKNQNITAIDSKLFDSTVTVG